MCLNIEQVSEQIYCRQSHQANRKTSKNNCIPTLNTNLAQVSLLLHFNVLPYAYPTPSYSCPYTMAQGWKSSHSAQGLSGVWDARPMYGSKFPFYLQVKQLCIFDSTLQRVPEQTNIMESLSYSTSGESHRYGTTGVT